MPTINEVIKRLQEEPDKEKHIAVAIWNEEDVKEVAEDLEIPKEDIQYILDEIDNDQDCNVGITWDTIQAHVDDWEDNQK
jgi:hypothetical protein